jgi:hypothetical protein
MTVAACMCRRMKYEHRCTSLLNQVSNVLAVVGIGSDPTLNALLLFGAGSAFAATTCSATPAVYRALPNSTSHVAPGLVPSAVNSRAGCCCPAGMPEAAPWG